ncbi:MAG: transcription termination/antitermination protein NusA [Bacilli bacterium]|nr:transcription termination/antitermination protein NusA [Bacilli bacterium]
MVKLKKEKVESIDKAKEFLMAVENIVKEKGIDKEVVFEAMENGLTTAFKKNYGKSNSKVLINRETGEIKVYSYLTVVEEKREEVDADGNVTIREINPEIEISLEDAKKIDKTLEIGDTIDTEIKPKDDFSRVATSTAKQVVVQKIREAERNSILTEFDGKDGELLLGTVALEDSDNYYIDLGRSNGVLPKREIIPGEKIEMGSSIKVYVTKIDNSGRNLLIKLSRSHYGFVRRLFELEIPEFSDGTVLMHAVAREAGVRSKVAVYSENDRVDAIGSCIGEKGVRIANIIKELGGEKIDLVRYDKDPKIFIENALSPAKNLTVIVTDPKKNEAIVVADKENFSLAIGKRGINAKLASRLTKYKLDIKTVEEARELGIKVE